MKTIALALCLVMLTACAHITIPSTVKRVSVGGTQIMMTVQTMVAEVEKAETDGRLPRNSAVKVMGVLSKITDAALEMIKYLTLMMKSDSATELSTNVDKVTAALETISTGLFQAFIPIQDEGLKADLGKLAAEMAQTMTIVNREILGRAYAK